MFDEDIQVFDGFIILADCAIIHLISGAVVYRSLVMGKSFCCIDHNIIPFLPTALDYLAQIFRFRRFCLPRINAIPTETE